MIQLNQSHKEKHLAHSTHLSEGVFAQLLSLQTATMSFSGLHKWHNPFCRNAVTLWREKAAPKREAAEEKTSISILVSSCCCTGSDSSCLLERLQLCRGQGEQKHRQGAPAWLPWCGDKPRIAGQEPVSTLPKAMHGLAPCWDIQVPTVQGARACFPFMGNFYKKRPGSPFCTF